jgi:hypothetical protein
MNYNSYPPAMSDILCSHYLIDQSHSVWLELNNAKIMGAGQFYLPNG